MTRIALDQSVVFLPSLHCVVLLCIALYLCIAYDGTYVSSVRIMSFILFVLLFFFFSVCIQYSCHFVSMSLEGMGGGLMLANRLQLDVQFGDSTNRSEWSPWGRFLIVMSTTARARVATKKEAATPADPSLTTDSLPMLKAAAIDSGGFLSSK